MKTLLQLLRLKIVEHDRKTVMNGEYVRMWKDAVMTYMKIS
jgi:hypothetical protein